MKVIETDENTDWINFDVMSGLTLGTVGPQWKSCEGWRNNGMSPSWQPPRGPSVLRAELCSEGRAVSWGPSCVTSFMFSGRVPRKQCWGNSLRSCHFPANRNDYREKLSLQAFMASMNRFHKWTNKDPRPWLRMAGSPFYPPITATLCFDSPILREILPLTIKPLKMASDLEGSLHCGLRPPEFLEERRGVDAMLVQCKSTGHHLLRTWGRGFMLLLLAVLQ